MKTIIIRRPVLKANGRLRKNKYKADETWLCLEKVIVSKIISKPNKAQNKPVSFFLIWLTITLAPNIWRSRLYSPDENSVCLGNQFNNELKRERAMWMHSK